MLVAILAAGGGAWTATAAAKPAVRLAFIGPLTGSNTSLGSVAGTAMGAGLLIFLAEKLRGADEPAAPSYPR